jgi:hypothetical protein
MKKKCFSKIRKIGPGKSWEIFLEKIRVRHTYEMPNFFSNFQNVANSFVTTALLLKN